jgi:hypothetical protein
MRSRTEFKKSEMGKLFEKRLLNNYFCGLSNLLSLQQFETLKFTCVRYLKGDGDKERKPRE